MELLSAHSEGVIALTGCLQSRFCRRLVATADVHYLRREDYDSHAALLCVQTKSTIEQPKLRFDTNEFYLKSSDEMTDAFSDMPEALASTLEIAERCDIEMELGQLLLPRFPTPEV